MDERARISEENIAPEQKTWYPNLYIIKWDVSEKPAARCFFVLKIVGTTGL